MTVKEAFDLIRRYFPLAPKKCKEYENHFVFFLRSFDEFDSAMAINKKTKKVSVFSPLLFSPEELKTGGKEVKI